MNDNNYLQSNDGKIYKVMDKYLLQMSPWKDGDDRRVYEYDDSDMTVITYQNACMIVNKQFAETDEEWEHKGKRYLARKLDNKSIDEHTAMLSMLPSHYINQSKNIIINEYLPKVAIHDTFGKFCQWVNIKNVKPIFNETDKKYV